jgi:adiponectin receptor
MNISNFRGPICKAPSYLKDQYIKKGYRINFSSKKDVVKSLFMWHNELINIWTHLIGAIIIISLIFYLWLNYDELFRTKAIESFNGKHIS